MFTTAAILVPSAEQAMDDQLRLRAVPLFVPKNQLAPELVEIEMNPDPYPTAWATINLLPSAEEATRFPVGIDGFHVFPELVEMYTGPSAAIKRVPSAEEAIELQAATGALLVTHAAPELVDRHIPALTDVAAANLVPSADEATLVQYELVFAPVNVHAAWLRAQSAASRPQRTRTTRFAESARAFMFDQVWCVGLFTLIRILDSCQRVGR